MYGGVHERLSLRGACLDEIGVKDLRAEYIKGLADPIQALMGAVAGRRVDSEVCDAEIRRTAHQLRGSGASFGFQEVTDAAAAVLEAKTSRFQKAARDLLEMLEGIVERGAGNTSRLLIVEDDPAIRLLLGAALEGLFDRVDSVESLAEARECIAGPPPALILLDLVLPDGDGREFLAEIRSRPEFEHVRIAVMSAHTREVVRDECIGLGADGYIQKPFRSDRIAGEVAELLHPTVRTPSTVPKPPRSDAPHHTPISTGNSDLKVLVAEDDALTAGLIVDRLQRRGYAVVHCPDGQAALEAARYRKFALAVIDLNMPRMNGFELLTRLRRMRRHSGTPVLVLTGLGDEKNVVRAFDLGADDYMVKPFSPTELTARVARLIAG